MDANILISNERNDDFLPSIERCDDCTQILQFDKSCIVLLAFYFFGTPSLFHKYCVARKLVDYGYCNETNNLLYIIKNEFTEYIDSFIGLLSCNPEWLEMEVGIMITHEFGHYLYANNEEFYTQIKNNVFDYITNFEKLEKTFNPIKVLLNSFNKHMLKRMSKDSNIVEELAADTFAFNHLCDICSYIGDNVKSTYVQTYIYPSIMAAISGSRFFSEYVSIVNRIYFNPPNANEKQRLINNSWNQFKRTIEDNVRTSYIEQIVKTKIKKNGKINIRKFYQMLIYPRVRRFNLSLNKDVCSYLQPYMSILKHGGKITCNNEEYDSCLAHLNEFEDRVCSLISWEIIKKKEARLQSGISYM